MDFLTDAWINDYQKTHSVLIGWITLYGPWIILGALSLLARLDPKIPSNNIIEWLQQFWKKKDVKK